MRTMRRLSVIAVLAAGGLSCSLPTDADDVGVMDDAAPPVCGNGRVDEGEECDALGAETAFCDRDCTLPTCGDGHANPLAGERCDDGNNVSADGCRADCVSDEACGNGIIDNHLPLDRNSAPMLCRDATRPGTGCAEVCDDGNTASGDGCSANCLSEETCPNGVLDASGNGGSNPPEQCDDGNTIDTDTCRNDCTRPP